MIRTATTVSSVVLMFVVIIIAGMVMIHGVIARRWRRNEVGRATGIIMGITIRRKRGRRWLNIR